ncbi:MAG TPA: Crp/Fnr family transcriptional regulator [Sphingomonas sp.]|uniref:Crp/Fnr family transcriptional regulator n=1 Tax=Sphingomonas sp. TaxID=28214 RepID=UPI002EDBA2E5
MIESLIRKLERRDVLADFERKALIEAFTEVREYRPHEIVVRESVEQTTSNLLLEGILCRYKDLRDGRRQIVALHVPGDFADLHSFLLKHLEHNLAALTPARIAIFPHARLREISERFPHLTRMLWFSTLLDAAIHRQWILSVGRRSAVARLAHLFCELRARLDVVGMVNAEGFKLPLTQIDLADATGLTPVHVNRMLRELRDRGLMEFRQGEVSIQDLAGLTRLAEFDPEYLYLRTREH